MKTSAIRGMAVLFFLFTILSRGFAAELKEIDGKALEAIMADGKPFVIVDVREPDEYAAGHIKGAINIPFKPAKTRIFRELVPKDRIVFVCHGGPMGHELGKALAQNNYPDVYNLTGGMKNWRGAIVK